MYPDKPSFELWGRSWLAAFERFMASSQDDVHEQCIFSVGEKSNKAGLAGKGGSCEAIRRQPIMPLMVTLRTWKICPLASTNLLVALSFWLTLFFQMKPLHGQASSSFDAAVRGVVLEEQEKAEIPKGRSVVVVIGIDKYKNWPELHTAVSDAQGVKQALIGKMGFVSPFPDLMDSSASKEAIVALVQDRLRKELKPDDSLIFFFAGHGQTRVDQVGGKTIETGFIVPVEAEAGEEEQWSQYIKLHDFLEDIGTLPARHVLVILDACHSGFALGSGVASYRAFSRFEKDLASRFSRRVITSAQKDQLAQDNGPVAGHSLFAGSLIDGLSWGKGDLDGDGLVTSSELGLFLQKDVGQYSGSKQTPDFGSFQYDNRGELIFTLDTQNFENLKARAFTALRQGRLQEFRGLVKEAASMSPERPETLYLNYRLFLSHSRIREASDTINRLLTMDLKRGTIPLSESDLWNLKVQLPFWEDVLSIPDSDFPLKLEFRAGKSKNEISVVQEKQLGELGVYQIDPGSFFQIWATNPLSSTVHVYLIEIDPAGRLIPQPLWENDEILFGGIKGGETQGSYFFRQDGEVEVSEMRIFSSSKRLPYMVSAPGVKTRGATPDLIQPEDLRDIHMKAIRYSTLTLEGLQ